MSIDDDGAIHGIPFLTVYPEPFDCPRCHECGSLLVWISSKIRDDGRIEFETYSCPPCKRFRIVDTWFEAL